MRASLHSSIARGSRARVFLNTKTAVRASSTSSVRSFERDDETEKAEQIFKAIVSPNTRAYNALINAYAQKGDDEKAYSILKRMRLEFNSGKNQNCRADAHTYNIILKAFNKSNRSDATERAEHIFKLIRSPDTVACNTLANIYAQKGDFDKALNLLHRMRSDFDSGKNRNCRPDMQTYNTTLKALQKSNRRDAVEKAEQFFDSIPSPNTVAYTTLLNIYAQHGEDQKALNLVHQMQMNFDSGINKNCRPDMHTYNVILNALYKSNRSDAVEKAEHIFNAIPSPDTVTYNTLANLYANRGYVDKALNIAQQMQMDFDSGRNRNCRLDQHTCSTILNALRKSNRSDAVEKAEQVFDAIQLPDTVMYNTLINMYAQKGNVEKALHMLHRMRLSFDSGEYNNCPPDMHTYATILKALQKSNISDATEKAEQIFDSIPSPNTFVYNTLINIYAKSRDIDKALSLAQRMQFDYDSRINKNCLPDMHTYNTILNAIQRSNRSDAVYQANQCFKHIPSPDTITYTTLLNIYAQNGLVEKVLDVLHTMQLDFDSGRNKQCRPDMHTYCSTLNALQKSNRLDVAERAEQIFRFIQSPDTVTYNALINIYAQNGEIDKALAHARQMQFDFDSGKNKHCRPDGHTYSTILVALYKLNRSDAVETAEQVIDAIQSPDTITYTCLLNIYAQKGNVRKILQLLRKMQYDFDSGTNKHCRPDMQTYCTIFKAMQTSNQSVATEQAERIFDSIHLPDTFTYNTLLNLYAEKRSGQKAVELARHMLATFHAGTNPNCQPNRVTKTILVKALFNARNSDLDKQAHDILEWFRGQHL